jgi:hypothetical protein
MARDNKGSTSGLRGFQLGTFDSPSDRAFFNNRIHIIATYHPLGNGKKVVVGFDILAASVKDVARCNETDTILDMLEVVEDARILHAYSIEWHKSHVIDWKHRWDPYVSTSSTQEKHPLSMIMTVMGLFCTTIAIVFLLLRIFRPEPMDREQIELEVFGGWKTLDRDVFRLPVKDFLLAPLIGVGIQLLVSTMLLMCMSMGDFGFFFSSIPLCTID